MAGQTVDEALRHFSLEERARFAHARTLEALNPLVTESQLERARRECVDWAGVPRALAQRLADRHGMEGELILARAEKELPAAADPEQWLWCAEALHAADHTMCLHLTDFYLRRTPLTLSRRDHGLAFVNAIADTLGGRLGWTSSRRNDEINALQNRLNWDLSAIISG